MEYVKLGDYCDITSSKRVFANQYTLDGVPFYRSREIIEKKEMKDISEQLFISQELYDTFRKKFGVPQKGDLLLTSVGTLGIPYIVKDEVFYFKDGNLTWMKNFKDTLNSKYLYYWLNAKFGKDSLVARAIGSSQPALTIDILKKYKFFIQDLHIQNKIVDILSTYDALIENNNRRIALLEKAAQELYKEWFVRFRFPGYETAEFENGIPVGWEVKKLFDVANVTYGYAFKSDLFCSDKTLNPVVRIRDIPDNQTNTYTIEQCDDKYLIKENSIIIGMDGIFHMCLWNGGKAYLNQRVVMLDSKYPNLNNLYLYYSLYPQVKYWEQIIAGTTVAHLGDKHLKKMHILLPTEDILEKSHIIFNNLMLQKTKLFKQNQNLIKQRDLLLPRLMSGKLEV